MKDRNENRPGYKKTKAGWIPKEWKEKKVGSACRIRNELRLPLSTEVRKTMQGAYPYYGPTGILDHIDHFRINGKYVLIAEDGDHFLKFTTKPMTLMVSGEFNVNNHAHIVEGTDICISEWFHQYFINKNLYVHITRQGAGRFKLNKAALKSIPMPVPFVAEQKKIAKILSTWDTAIDQTRKLIKSKIHRKKALMQRLLMGKSRLAGFIKKKGREAYRFFDFPVDWACPSLRELAKERSERNKGNGKATVLSCSKHKGFVESSQYFGKQVFSEDTSNYKVIRRGWFGYPSNHIEEGSIGLLSDHDVGIVSPIYTVFECSKKVISEYLYAVFKTETFRHIFSISTSSSVDRRGSLRWSSFSLIKVPLPGKDEQQAIVNVLAEADKEIADMERKLNSIEKQKRGLMQKLLTGEVRVNP